MFCHGIVLYSSFLPSSSPPPFCWIPCKGETRTVYIACTPWQRKITIVNYLFVEIKKKTMSEKTEEDDEEEEENWNLNQTLIHVFFAPYSCSVFFFVFRNDCEHWRKEHLKKVINSLLLFSFLWLLFFDFLLLCPFAFLFLKRLWKEENTRRFRELQNLKFFSSFLLFGNVETKKSDSCGWRDL
jgi:hypothetical protein